MSGLSHTPGKRARGKTLRGFESRPLRQLYYTNQALRRFFCFDYRNNHQTRREHPTQDARIPNRRATPERVFRWTGGTHLVRIEGRRGGGAPRASRSVGAGGSSHPTEKIERILDWYCVSRWPQSAFVRPPLPLPGQHEPVSLKRRVCPRRPADKPETRSTCECPVERANVAPTLIDSQGPYLPGSGCRPIRPVPRLDALPYPRPPARMLPLASGLFEGALPNIVGSVSLRPIVDSR